MNHLKICSLNVRGLQDGKKRKSVFNFMKTLKYDIYLLQETHLDGTKNHNLWRQQWGGHIFASYGTSNARGVTTLISPNFGPKVSQRYSDKNGRINCVDFCIGNQKYVIANIYGPNEDSSEFIHEVIRAVEYYPEFENTIIGGDFNFVMDAELDRNKSSNNYEDSLLTLKEYMNKANLEDLWRVRNPTTKRFTWCRQNVRGKLMGSRLDMFLISSHLCTQAETSIEYGHKTDHARLDLDITLYPFKKGHGVWKFNNLLLQDEVFKSEIIALINKTFAEKALEDADEAWRVIKSECINHSKEYGKKKASGKKNELNKLIELEQKLVIDVTNTEHPDAIKGLKQVRNQIDQYDKIKTESSIFRSKAEFVKSGEKSSKFFFSLEKRRYMDKTPQCIINDQGKVVIDVKDILQEQFKFYKGLYSKDRNVKFTLVPDADEPRIAEYDKLQLEQPIMVDEIFDAIMTLKSGKTAGNDGLSLEFYRCFYSQLKIPLIRMYYAAYSKGELPLSTRRGIISLLSKPKKDMKYIKNYRPITLQNYDYKILAKIIDNRMRLVLEDIIHQDQTGFMKGRHLTTNIRKSLDVIEYCAKTNKPGLILSIDMEKCFDRVDYTAVRGALEYFNFGPSFIRWSMLFFTNFEVCTQNRGFISKYFKKERSINQGCPYSPSVYLLISEIIANKLRRHQDIKGINIGKVELLLSLFADDMDMYLPYDQIVLNAVVSALAKMEINLGIKVSYDKTTLYRIGSIANSDAKLYTTRPIKWSSSSINTLGIDLYNNRTDMVQNYEGLIMKMETVMNTWYYRTLTLMGKVLIVNSLCASLFVYRMQVAPQLDGLLLKRINEMVSQFIWNKKKAKLSLGILQKPKKQGGLGLVNFQAKHTALMLNWIPRIQSNNIIYELACHFIGDFVKDNKIWTRNIKRSDVGMICNSKSGFWYELLCEWCDYNTHFSQSKEKVEKEYINLNSYIRSGNKMCQFKGMDHITIADLLNEEDQFYSYANFCAKTGVKIGWLEYLSMINAIPSLWKFALKSPDMIDDGGNKSHLIADGKNKSISRAVYFDLVAGDEAVTKSGKVWCNKLGAQFEYEAHEKAFTNLYKVTNITKLRNFNIDCFIIKCFVTTFYIIGRKWNLKSVNTAVT